jgi:proteic killer suppression protein
MVRRKIAAILRSTVGWALPVTVLINAAESINDLRVPPGHRLEKLVGARAGQYSIRVDDQWRICFTWSARGAGNIELVDDH